MKKRNVILGLLIACTYNTAAISSNLDAAEVNELLGAIDTVPLVNRYVIQDKIVLETYANTSHVINDFADYEFVYAKYLNDEKNEIIKSLNSIDIDIIINDSDKIVSYTNISNNFNECMITIKENPKITMFMKEKEKDIKFILTNELSNCYLTRNIFSKEDFWKFKLDSNIKEYLNIKIQEKTDSAYINTDKGKVLIETLPIAIYHQIYSDIYAAINLYNKKEIDVSNIEEVIEKRNLEYLKIENNISFNGLSDLVKIIHEGRVNEVSEDELAHLLSQKYFIEYLLTD